MMKFKRMMLALKVVRNTKKNTIMKLTKRRSISSKLLLILMLDVKKIRNRTREIQIMLLQAAAKDFPNKL